MSIQSIQETQGFEEDIPVSASWLERGARPKDVHLLCVVDTDEIAKNHPQISTNQARPTQIDKGLYLMVTGAENIKNNATPHVEFTTHVGANVFFRGVSITANSQDAIVVYGIVKLSGVDVFNNFRTSYERRTKAVVDNATNPDGNPLPPKFRELDFLTYDSRVATQGTENFNIRFAIYELHVNQVEHVLKGYCQWDPKITVL